ncbi:MAG: hypothetical protein SGI74_03505 [Oligoflexia bacterium]|nr:hypothetical protein [Oligoflexia bacterium]
MSDNSIKCWGYNGYGQLGLDDVTQRAIPPATGVTAATLGANPVAVAVGYYHTCALLSTGKIKCWGYNGFGELGQGHANNLGDFAGEMAALPVVNLGTNYTASAISTLANATCAIVTVGATTGVKCWGYNLYGQLGLGDNINRGDSAVANHEMGDLLPFVNLGTGRTPVSISTGYYHACVILDNNATKCWGYNGYGNLGYGDVTQRGSAVNQMGDLLLNLDFGSLTAMDVYLGNQSSCAVLSDGSTKCWGYNGFGELGVGHTGSVGNANGQMGVNIQSTSF